MIGTKLSDQDLEYVSYLAGRVGVNHRQIIEASLMVFLSRKGFQVDGLSKIKLEDFWAPYQPHGQGEAVQFLLEENQSGDPWTIWGERDGRPLDFKNQTILLDASVLLLCLGQEKRAKLVVERLLKSAARVVITSAIISEVAIKGLAILAADAHTSVEARMAEFKMERVRPDQGEHMRYRLLALISNIASINVDPTDYPEALQKVVPGHTQLTRLVSLAAVHRARRQQVVTVLRAVKAARPKHLEFCHKPFQMGDSEFSRLTNS